MLDGGPAYGAGQFRLCERHCVCLGSEKHIIFQGSVSVLTPLHVFKSFNPVFSFPVFAIVYHLGTQISQL